MGGEGRVGGGGGRWVRRSVEVGYFLKCKVSSLLSPYGSSGKHAFMINVEFREYGRIIRLITQNIERHFRIHHVHHS